MLNLSLLVGSLRYSSWSMRAWLALQQTGARFATELLPLMTTPDWRKQLAAKSPTGRVPVLVVDGTAISETLAICEWAAEQYPEARLWPEDRLTRALARAMSSEMATGFMAIRSQLSCHDHARVPGFRPNEATTAELERLWNMWGTALEHSGGPFLMGEFGIVDCMYLPMVSRLRTYGIELPEHARQYSDALWSQPSVVALQKIAADHPAIAEYDEHIRGLGGDLKAGAPR